MSNGSALRLFHHYIAFITIAVQLPTHAQTIQNQENNHPADQEKKLQEKLLQKPGAMIK